MYAESMGGATTRSTPKASKIDERELTRLRKQDYWLQITRAKLVMDLVFVCTLETQGIEQQFANDTQLMIYFASSVQESR